jgi:hypothetical protein
LLEMTVIERFLLNLMEKILTSSLSTITTQVVFEIDRTNVIPEVATKIMFVAIAEVFDMHTIDVSCVGGMAGVYFALVDEVL